MTVVHPGMGAFILRGGGGRQHNFAQFSLKRHEIEKNWTPEGEGVSLTPP